MTGVQTCALPIYFRPAGHGLGQDRHVHALAVCDRGGDVHHHRAQFRRTRQLLPRLGRAGALYLHRFWIIRATANCSVDSSGNPVIGAAPDLTDPMQRATIGNKIAQIESGAGLNPASAVFGGYDAFSATDNAGPGEIGWTVNPFNTTPPAVALARLKGQHNQYGLGGKTVDTNGMLNPTQRPFPKSTNGATVAPQQIGGTNQSLDKALRLSAMARHSAVPPKI